MKTNRKTKTKDSVRQLVKKAVHDMLPLKYVDTPFRSFPTTSGTFININLPGVQGVANGQRSGDEIMIDRIEVRDYLLYGDSPVNTIRAIYFQSKGDVPISSSAIILANDYSGAPGITSQYQSFIEKTGIRILSDTTTVVCGTGSNAVVVREFKMAPKIAKIAFDSGGTTASDGQTQLFLISDSSVVPNPTYVADVRVYYKDV